MLQDVDPAGASQAAGNDVVAGVCDSIAKSFDRVPEGLGRPDGLAIRFAEAGRRVPIFWCFNNWSEPVLLSHRLGPDQPLVAMRSLHGFLKGKSSKAALHRSMAALYGGQILASLPADAPILLGGNCQAASIAAATAQHIMQGGRVPLLMTLDHRLAHGYPGSVLMMFGSHSQKYNPFLADGDPVPGWRAQHHRFAWRFVEGAHGRYFLDPAVGDLARHIGEATERFCDTGELETGGPAPSDPEVS